MYAVFYHWRLKPGTEERFRKAWRRATELIRDEAGGMGSRLHRCDDGTWIAYAQWPSQERRDEALNAPPVAPAESEIMRECIEESLPTRTCTLTDDMLIPLEFGKNEADGAPAGDPN